MLSHCIIISFFPSRSNLNLTSLGLFSPLHQSDCASTSRSDATSPIGLDRSICRVLSFATPSDTHEHRITTQHQLSRHDQVHPICVKSCRQMRTHKQVTPRLKGADWMSARAWPVCQHFHTPTGEKLLVMGGDARHVTSTDSRSVKGVSSAVLLHLCPSPANAELQQSSDAELKERLKNHIGRHHLSCAVPCYLPHTCAM